MVSIEWQAFLEIILHGKQIEANIGILFQDKGGKDKNDNSTTVVTRGLKVTHAWPFVVGFNFSTSRSTRKRFGKNVSRNTRKNNVNFCGPILKLKDIMIICSMQTHQAR